MGVQVLFVVVTLLFDEQERVGGMWGVYGWTWGEKKRNILVGLWWAKLRGIATWIFILEVQGKPQGDFKVSKY